MIADGKKLEWFRWDSNHSKADYQVFLSSFTFNLFEKKHQRLIIGTERSVVCYIMTRWNQFDCRTARNEIVIYKTTMTSFANQWRNQSSITDKHVALWQKQFLDPTNNRTQQIHEWTWQRLINQVSNLY